MEVILGRKYKDTLHGFKGVATAHCIYLTGCAQVRLERHSKLSKETTEQWFDTNRLEIQPGKQYVAPEMHVDPGGPQDHPASRHP